MAIPWSGPLDPEGEPPDRRVLPEEGGSVGLSGRFTAEELAEAALKLALGAGWREKVRLVRAERRMVVECDLLADAIRLEDLMGGGR